MSVGKGYSSKAAFKIETGAYGTSIALNGAAEYNMLHLISEGISPSFNYEKSVALDGSAGSKTMYPVLKKYSGDLVLEGWYRGLESILIAAFGMSHQNLSPVDEGDGAYKHYLELSDDISTRAFDIFDMTTPSGNAIRRGTLAFEKNVSIWEFASTMINSVSIESSPERTQITLNAVAEGLTLDSGTNNASTNWALPANGTQLLFSDMDVYLKARDIFTITSSNDTLSVNETGDVTLDVPDGVYTGYELAQAFQIVFNTNATLTGVCKCTYDEETRKFTIKSTVAFVVNGNGASYINATMGFVQTGATASSTIQTSNYQAVPDSFAAFDSDDKVGVNSINWSLENSLDTDSQDSESDSKIIEPERNGIRNITGSIEIPRYEDDDFIKSVNGFTTYEMLIKFTGDLIGGANYEEFNVYLPQIKFTNASAPIGGAALIKQSLNFEAQSPEHFLDLVNFIFGDYLIKSLKANADVVQCAGAAADGLYIGDTNGVVWKNVAGAWSSSCDSGLDTAYAIKQYGNKLFAGFDSGKILEKNSSDTWSSSTDVGSGLIIDFELYGGELYALEQATGKIFVNDGSSWSLSCDTVSTEAYCLKSYNGNLYMAGADANGKVWEFNGSAWSLSCDFTIGTINWMGMDVHDGKLFVSTVDGGTNKLMSYDGTTWANVGTLTNSGEVKHIVSYKGNLLLFPYGASKDIFYWDFKAGTDVNLYSSYDKTLGSKPTKFNGRLLVPNGTTSINAIDPIKEMMIAIQNENATNPL